MMRIGMVSGGVRFRFCHVIAGGGGAIVRGDGTKANSGWNGHIAISNSGHALLWYSICSNLPHCVYHCKFFAAVKAKTFLKTDQVYNYVCASSRHR